MSSLRSAEQPGLFAPASSQPQATQNQPTVLRGSSGVSYGGPRRTPRQALDDAPAAIAAGNALRARIEAAAGDVLALADLMAEAIEMDRKARGLTTVGRDGRAMLTIDHLQASYCLDAARAAYLAARGGRNS